MKKKQQATVEIEATTKTSRPPFPFEEELVSLIRKAIVEGYSQNQTVSALKQCWVENLPDLPEETEDEKAFRAQADKFLDSKYEEFNDWADKRAFANWYWEKTDELSHNIKRKFIHEVCCTIYKGFKMDTFDRNSLKKVNVERTKIMFPQLKRNHTTFYNMIVDALLKFSLRYEVEGLKKEQLEEFLEQFELSGKDDSKAAKFIWLVENFD